MGEYLVMALIFVAAVAVLYVFLRTMMDARDWSKPGFMSAWALRKRRAKFEEHVLDLTMGLANALKAGMAPPQAIERITEQMTGPMKEELQTVQREYRLGTDLPTAFDHLADRMKGEDIRLLASAIRLTVQTGGSLAEVLAEMTETIRARREFHDKLLTLTAQGRAEGIGLGVMPAIAFVIFYFIQPEMMMTLFTTAVGWCAVVVALTLEIVGFLLVRKICTVEV